jgi:hypothetical protein
MMRGKLCQAVAAIAIAASAQAACAMSTPSAAAAECTVTGGDKLPVESGGADALCAAIKKAVGARIPGVGFAAKVNVVSDWKMGATITTADGRHLPEQKHVVMDAKLNRTSFERFANALAEKVAGLPRPGKG